VSWVALVAWIATAVGGLTLGAQWTSEGGPSDERGIGRARLGVHALLAIAGLVSWIVYTLGGDDVFAWIAVALLAIVIAVGLWMFTIWLRGRSPRAHRTELPAETAFPVPLVFVHGLLAVTTLVLALVAALI
jgi:hypothetical protein